MVQGLEQALNRRPNGIGTLDGGQATHLETLGFDLSSPLWSASLLARKDDPAAHDAITRVHRDFINAGADIIGTMTYQLSDLAWEKAHSGSAPPEGEVARLMAEALRLAAEARASSSRPQTLISLSLGPYGAALANGAEYTGAYPSNVDMVDFHARRLRQAMASPHFSSDIDLIAFETLPRLDEAQAVLDALELVASEAPTATMPPAYLSFVFEASGKLPGGRDGVEEILALLARHRGRWPVVGMGVNCTKMPILEKVVRDLAGDKGLHLFLYPDGGLTWDGIARKWRGTTSTDGWAQSLAQLARDAKPQWKGVWVGGCCKVGPEEIQKLGELV